MSKIRVDQLSDVADTKTITVVNITQVGDLVAGNIVSTPVGTITSTNVQGALSQVNTQLAAKQPLDATLTALSGVSTTTDTIIYNTGIDSFSTTPLTPFARTLLDDVSAAAARTTLGTTSLILGSAVTLSGSNVDFGSIPSNVNRFTLLFDGVSTSSTSIVTVQLGTTSGFETTGYLGGVFACLSGTTNVNAFGVGVELDTSEAAATTRHGSVVFTRTTGNRWSISGNLALSNTARFISVAGTKATAGVLDRVRITTVGGVSTFDTGTVTLLVEG